MNCIHCAGTPHDGSKAAVGVCANCGSAACQDHARVVTAQAQPGGLVPSRAAVRRVLCSSC